MIAKIDRKPCQIYLDIMEEKKGIRKMKYVSTKEVPNTLGGLEDFEKIPEHNICEVKNFFCTPTIFYKGKAVCNVGSNMCEDYFKIVEE